jgi:hypothetical protein
MKINADVLFLVVYSLAAITFFIAYYERIINKYTNILDGAKGVIKGKFTKRLFEVVRLEGEYKNRRVTVEVDGNYSPFVKVKLKKRALSLLKNKLVGFADPTYLLSVNLFKSEDNFIAVLDELCYICEKIESGEFITNNPKDDTKPFGK